MTRRFEVSARLAEGREAVQHTQAYVSACRLLGYQHRDLTGYVGQVEDCYAGEDGMDLQLLDADCAELWAVAAAADQAMGLQRSQCDAIVAVWRGPGAVAAVDFLRQHCADAAASVGGLYAAARACARLRDELWRLVDEKVTAAIAIDDRVAAQRPLWLVAAHTVVAGGAQQSTVDDVIKHQVEPYVRCDVGVDWLTAMQSARTAQAAAYDLAAAAVAPDPAVVFRLPGVLGPCWVPDESGPSAPVMPAAVRAPGVGAAPVPPPSSPPPPPPPASVSAPLPMADPLAAPLDDAPAWPADAGLAGAGLPAGFGLPAGAGSLGGLIPRLIDAVTGLLGPADDTGVVDPELTETIGDDHKAVSGSGEAADEPEDPGESHPVVDAPEPAADTGDTVIDAVGVDSAADPADQPAASTSDAASPAMVDAEQTPCQIAADELPRAGP